MRYFGFAMKTGSEQIRENAKIKLRDYDYQSPVAAMNSYMYKNMKNGICYFAYREEADGILSFQDSFWLDRDENTESSYEKLKKMIGLVGVKEQIDHIIAADIVEKERKKRRGSAYETGTMHMIFGGSPWSAKTTVAKLFAGIAKEKGILKSGAFVERGGMDLNGLGCIMAIRDAFTAAAGGVLFIDEAYSLQNDTAVTGIFRCRQLPKLIHILQSGRAA